jgi:translation initiation factor 6 (eIF-6)
MAFWIICHMIAMKGQEINELQIIYMFIRIMKEIYTLVKNQIMVNNYGFIIHKANHEKGWVRSRKV